MCLSRCPLATYRTRSLFRASCERRGAGPCKSTTQTEPASRSTSTPPTNPSRFPSREQPPALYYNQPARIDLTATSRTSPATTPNRFRKKPDLTTPYDPCSPPTMAKASARDLRDDQRPHDLFPLVKDRACGLTRQTLDPKLAMGAQPFVQRNPQHAAILSRLPDEFNHLIRPERFISARYTTIEPRCTKRHGIPNVLTCGNASRSPAPRSINNT